MKFLIAFVYLVFNVMSLEANSTNYDNNNNLDPSKLTQESVGLFNKLPNGPLSDDQLERAYNDQMMKESQASDYPAGIVTISENLKKKKLGKLRIRSTKMDLYFPTDPPYIGNISEDPKNREIAENRRIELERAELIKGDRDESRNPYINILNEEADLRQDLKLSKNHKKNLMNLAIEKEQEILNKMVKNEVDEVKRRKFNRGYYSPLMKSNLGI